MVKASKASSKKTSCAKASSSSSSKRTSASKPQSERKQKILDICLFFEQKLNNPEVPRKKVQTMAGANSNGFAVAICNMKKAGLVDYTKEYIRLTEEGRATANAGVVFNTDNKASQEQTMKRLKISEGKKKVLMDILLDGKTHDRANVMGRVGMVSKNSENVLLSNLKKSGAISYDKTTIMASDVWFPHGRDTDGETSD